MSASCVTSAPSYDEPYCLANASQLARIHGLLTTSTVQYLLRLHPNDLASETANVPSEWLEWKSWSRSASRGWLELVRYYMTGIQLSPEIPAPLRGLLDEIRTLQLSRRPIILNTLPPMKDVGMSPKKAHEVSRMVAYVIETIKVNGWDSCRLRIVDVGAGQGYLTRALKIQLPRAHILALDADERQTIGAQRWENRLVPSTSEEHPPITHNTIHITPEELFKAIDGWISEASTDGDTEEIPVLLIGLHACGSLTPDIIRTFSQSNEGRRCWKFAGAVVVGCCYNLMNPGEFPLSGRMKALSPFIELPASAYHLAAQIPAQWLTALSPPTPTPSVELALRKVTWRALLGKKLRHLQSMSSPSGMSPQVNINLAPGRQPPWSRLPAAKMQNFDSNEVGTGATLETRRLGRLRDTAYQNWDIFLDVAEKRMGVDFGSTASNEVVVRDVELERFLEVVHTLRCLVGPVVESVIILDRMVWLDEVLCAERCGDVQAKIVNLFDQATGSGRNIAFVIAPSIPSIR